MKKFIFGLIAVVMFGFVGNAQSIDTDFLSAPKGLVKTEYAGKTKITYHVEFGNNCWSKKGCGATVTIVFDNFKVGGGKYLFICDKLDPKDFLASSKYFSPALTGLEVGIFLPEQKMIYNKDLGGFEATLEFYK